MKRRKTSYPISSFMFLLRKMLVQSYLETKILNKIIQIRSKFRMLKFFAR